ncbi:MAG TPA: hypothetical protein VGI32_15035 [Steroidobacteraceae bacterium]|jgi:hypothetical protein
MDSPSGIHRRRQRHHKTIALIRAALIPHGTRDLTHDPETETTVGRLGKRSGQGCIRTAARVERDPIILGCDHNAIGADLNDHVDVQFAALRCAVAQDVAGDFLKDQFNVVASASGKLNGVTIERAAQRLEALFEAAQRSGK